MSGAPLLWADLAKGKADHGRRAFEASLCFGALTMLE